MAPTVGPPTVGARTIHFFQVICLLSAMASLCVGLMHMQELLDFRIGDGDFPPSMFRWKFWMDPLVRNNRGIMAAYNLGVPLSALVVGAIDTFLSRSRPWLGLGSGLLLFPAWTYQVTAFMICENFANPENQVPSYCPTWLHYAIKAPGPNEGLRLAMLSLAYVAAASSAVYAFFSLMNTVSWGNARSMAKSVADKDMESVNEDEWKEVALR